MASQANSAGLRVAILAGGPSAEREISLLSGQAVFSALQQTHRCELIDLSRQELNSIDFDKYDCVFNAVHGALGEDGVIAHDLAERGIPWTGCDAESSRLTFSKLATREQLNCCDIRTLPFAAIRQSDTAARISRRATEIGFPLFVKPDRSGSSLGVSHVAAAEDLARALGPCFHLDDCGLLERAVSGDEWTVSIIDGEPLPPVRITTPRAFYDYVAKYSDDATTFDFGESESAELSGRLQLTAVRAARVLGTTPLCRVDLRLDEFGEPWILEVNTVPGLTDHSLLPMAAARVGMSMTDLCDRLITTALTGAKSRAAA